MAQQINVPGVGLLQFPDGMSDADMAAAIRKNFPQIHDDGLTPAQRQKMGEGTDSFNLPAGTALSTLAEGARRTWGSLKQTGADLTDAARFFMGTGAPTMTANPGQGLQQNTDPSLLGAQVTSAENARQAAFRAQNQRQFGPGGAQAIEQGAGAVQTGLSMIPALATEGALGPTTTLGGNVVRQGLVGAGTAALPYDPNNGKGGDAAAGAAFGATLGAAGGVINAARNMVAQGLRATAARSEAAYQAAKDVMGWGTAAAADTEPTLAMRTGAPAARTLEAQTFNARLQERYQRIRDGFMSRFQSVFDVQPAPQLDAAFENAKAGAESTIGSMKAARNKAYDDGMARAQALGQQVGYGPAAETGPATFTQGGVPQTDLGGYAARPQYGARVPASNFQAQYEATVAEDQGRFGAKALPADFIRDARTALAGGNGLSVKDTAGLLRRLTAMSDDSNPQVRAAAQRMRASFDTDLDLVEQNGSGAHPAVQQVLATRAAYRQASQDIDTLRKAAAYRFLGLGPNDNNVNPAQLVQRFSSFTPTKQQEIAGYLRGSAPELLSQMRGKVLADTAAAGLQKAGPAAASEASPGALIDQLFGDGQQVRTSGLWNSSELANMERFRQAARVIDNVVQKERGGAGTIVTPGDIAPNLVSRSAIFIARQSARLLTGGSEAIFTDPTAMNYWTKIRTTSGPTQSAAIVGFANFLARQNSRNEQGQAPQ